VTGGPVHAKIDVVKMVTNRFKGGLMASLAVALCDENTDVTYLCSHQAKTPSCGRNEKGEQWTGLPTGRDVPVPLVLRHDGFHDYREKVRELARESDVVILGAAVANLIPVGYKKWDYTHVLTENISLPLEGKFPSHDYKPGDHIEMVWQIAPRIIDEVKALMNPGAHLFGFKLLSGVPRDELITAAYGVLLESKATMVFANDAANLQQVYGVAKDRSYHATHRDQIPKTIRELVADEYYRTEVVRDWDGAEHRMAEGMMDEVFATLDTDALFPETPEGMVFGTVAVRHPAGMGFFTTARGKRELADLAWVQDVDHHDVERVVQVVGAKATLNAPLLDTIFADTDVERIVHHHQQEPGLPSYAWAPPGTVRDSRRVPQKRGHPWTSFNVDGHGCYLLYDREGNLL